MLINLNSKPLALLLEARLFRGMSMKMHTEGSSLQTHFLGVPKTWERLGGGSLFEDCGMVAHLGLYQTSAMS